MKKATIGALLSLSAIAGHAPAATIAEAQAKIKHIVVIMQENRSFDNYFGNFKDRNGNAADGSAFLSPKPTGTGSCSSTTYSPAAATKTVESDFPHTHPDAVYNLGGSGNLSPSTFLQLACNNNEPLDQVMTYHKGANPQDELYNYWTLAKNFTLQDKMFESVTSFSKLSHLYMVSGWAAYCVSGVGTEPPLLHYCLPNASGWESMLYPWNAGGSPLGGLTTAVNDTYPQPSGYGEASGKISNGSYYLWDDITELLRAANVSWGYYKGENWVTQCSACNSTPGRSCVSTSSPDPIISELWNPLQYFESVQASGDYTKIQGLDKFYSALNANPTTLPAVSWIVPGQKVSEHAGVASSDLRWGEWYVTAIVEAIMRKQDVWQSTAIFISWDDWGGFYDHVRPPLVEGTTADPIGYGLRVPGLVISPYVRKDLPVDHQQLSHDAYLKFVEDVFLQSKRVCDVTFLGQPTCSDMRPAHRENASQLGNLLNEFDFNRKDLLTPPSAVTSLPCSCIGANGALSCTTATDYRCCSGQCNTSTKKCK